MPVLLVLFVGILCLVGAGLILLLPFHDQRKRAKQDRCPSSACPSPDISLLPWPVCWLAVRTRNLAAVQSALGLQNPKPCSCWEGLAGGKGIFIAPPVRGWVLVSGFGLPDPSEDVDACFRFVLDLSRKLGAVHFFRVSRAVHHHAWVKAKRGRIVRAYAWAGKTLWTQGAQTPAEEELNFKCYDYATQPETNIAGWPEGVAENVDKVLLLAARWSLDPALVDESFLEGRGVVGEPTLHY